MLAISAPINWRRAFLTCVVLLAGFAPSFALAAGGCEAVAARYDQCLQDGVRAYSATTLGNGDFSYIARCTKEKNSAMQSQCHDQGAVEAAYAKVHARDDDLHRAERLNDNVRAVRRAGCDIVDRRYDENSHTFSVHCDRNIGGGHACTGSEYRHMNDWYCQLSEEEGRILSGEADDAIGRRRAETINAADPDTHVSPAICSQAGISVRVDLVQSTSDGSLAAVQATLLSGELSERVSFSAHGNPGTRAFKDSAETELNSICRVGMHDQKTTFWFDLVTRHRGKDNGRNRKPSSGAFGIRG